MHISIYKFGGSSVASAQQLKKVKRIIAQGDHKKIIVTSAIGKINEYDEKVTDLLIQLYLRIKNGQSYLPLWQTICDRYFKIERELGLSPLLKDEIKIISHHLNKNISYEYLISRGEYLSAKLLARFLNYKFIDATEIFSFNERLDIEETSKNIKNKLSRGNIVVPGFYGIGREGIKLFDRGGSDVSASVIAGEIGSIYYNYTDVAGVYDCDPSFGCGKVFKNLSYDQLEFLSLNGAKVIASGTTKYLKKRKIPLMVKNTNCQADEGTIITNKGVKRAYAIAIKDDNVKVLLLGKTKNKLINAFKFENKEKVKGLYNSLQTSKQYGKIIK